MESQLFWSFGFGQIFQNKLHAVQNNRNKLQRGLRLRPTWKWAYNTIPFFYFQKQFFRGFLENKCFENINIKLRVNIFATCLQVYEKIFFYKFCIFHRFWAIFTVFKIFTNISQNTWMAALIIFNPSRPAYFRKLN